MVARVVYAGAALFSSVDVRYGFDAPSDIAAAGPAAIFLFKVAEIGIADVAHAYDARIDTPFSVL